MVKKIIFLLVLVLFLAAAVTFASQSQYYADLGNITSDKSTYSCWPSGCLAYINLTINSTGPYANNNWTVSLNNTAEASPIEFAIDWYNGSSWVNQSNNHTFINNSNLNLTSGTHQFRVNITLTSPLSTKWNVSFNVNGTDYVLDPYLDSINLTFPENYNITTDQTPEFNFTLFSQASVLQSCTLYLNNNGTGTWTNYGINSSVINGSDTKITVSSTLTEANYTWLISCNESGNSSTRWIYIDDTTVPTISSVSSTPSSLTATITWNTNENANSTVNYGTTYSFGDSEVSASFTTSHSHELQDLVDSETYYYNVTSCDNQGNCQTSGTHSFTTSAYSSNTGSSGGSATTSSVKSKTWSLITEGSTKTWTLNDANSGIKEINVTVGNESRSVKITVSRYASKPSSVSVKAGEVYRYISINTENLQHLERASLMFQVGKSWMQNNSLTKGEISLFRFNNATNLWEEIHTTSESEDSSYNYFRSGLTSFSYFAIAEKNPEVESSETTSTDTTTSQETTPVEETTSEESSEGQEEKRNWTGMIIMIVIIGVVAIGVVAFIIYTQLFRNKRK